jgi:hypothetical protein
MLLEQKKKKKKKKGVGQLHPALLGGGKRMGRCSLRGEAMAGPGRGLPKGTAVEGTAMAGAGRECMRCTTI